MFYRNSLCEPKVWKPNFLNIRNRIGFGIWMIGILYSGHSPNLSLLVMRGSENQICSLFRLLAPVFVLGSYPLKLLSVSGYCKDTEPLYHSFYVLTCITSFRYLSINCNAFILFFYCCLIIIFSIWMLTL